jgi:hypothetical protein
LGGRHCSIEVREEDIEPELLKDGRDDRGEGDNEERSEHRSEGILLELAEEQTEAYDRKHGCEDLKAAE